MAFALPREEYTIMEGKDYPAAHAFMRNPAWESIFRLLEKGIRSKQWLTTNVTEEQKELLSLREEVTWLKEQLSDITKKVNSLECIELKIMPENDVRALIMKYISELEDGDQVYPGDIAFEYGIDTKCVESVMDKMTEDGVFR